MNKALGFQRREMVLARQTQCLLDGLTSEELWGLDLSLPSSPCARCAVLVWGAASVNSEVLYLTAGVAAACGNRGAHHQLHSPGGDVWGHLDSLSHPPLWFQRGVCSIFVS